MNRQPNNLGLAQNLIEALLKRGVEEFVINAGARNAPLVETLSKTQGIRRWSFFEERSAAFFALGRSLATQKPVAVVTTSGTAVAELIPAAIEAHYSGRELVLITADRPRRFRGSGAPQSIIQPGLFGAYVATTIDVESGEELDLSPWTNGSVHINVCFPEPLLTGKAQPPSRSLGEHDEKLSDPVLSEEELTSLKVFRKPLVIVAGLPNDLQKPVLEFLLALKSPVVAETLSGLRENESLQSLRIEGKESLKACLDRCDGVIRIGGVPTTRLWRDLDGGTLSHLPVVSISHLPFSGLGRQSTKPIDLDAFLSRKVNLLSAWQDAELTELIQLNNIYKEKIIHLSEKYPRSEQAFFFIASKNIPNGSRIFLGNSLPIRHWDAFATFENRDLVTAANRGVNGIDGILSTFLGWAEGMSSESWLFAGDLTALYDLSAPWVISQMKHTNIHMVIVNNQGGQIFAPMFDNPAFINHHDLTFKPWAEMWRLDYKKVESIVEFEALLSDEPKPKVIELAPLESETKAFESEWRGEKVGK